MPTRLVHLVADALDPPALARFWAAALGWEVVDENEHESNVAPAGYHYPDAGAVLLCFVPVPEPKTGKNRVHLDLATGSAVHQAAEVERLLALGAVHTDIGQKSVPWVVLADPEGNEFCVLDPRPKYRDTGPVAAIVLDCPDPIAATKFWRTATGWVPARPDEDYASLRAPAGVGPFLELLPSDDVKTVKDRIHIDVAPHRGEDHAAAVRELLAAGAVPIDIGQGGVGWTVLAGPEGNEFCVLSPRLPGPGQRSRAAAQAASRSAR
ncbi:MAG TPA: VOC family protein [Streptosporangiaceae bacterium]|jgi:predicted enzyme related to lactoylglutathione lyase